MPSCEFLERLFIAQFSLAACIAGLAMSTVVTCLAPPTPAYTEKPPVYPKRFSTFLSLENCLIRLRLSRWSKKKPVFCPWTISALNFIPFSKKEIGVVGRLPFKTSPLLSASDLCFWKTASMPTRLESHSTKPERFQNSVGPSPSNFKTACLPYKSQTRPGRPSPSPFNSLKPVVVESNKVFLNDSAASNRLKINSSPSFSCSIAQTRTASGLFGS